MSGALVLWASLYVWGKMVFTFFSLSIRTDTGENSLYGATLAQTIFYFKTFPNDRKYLIFLVSDRDAIWRLAKDQPICLQVTSLFVLDTFHVCCLCSGFWLFLVLGKLDNTLLLVLPWFVPWIVCTMGKC